MMQLVLTMSRQSSVIIMTQMRFCKLYTCTPRHRTLLPTSPPFTRLLPSNSRVPQKWSQSSFPPTSASWTCPSSWTPRHTPPTLPWSSPGTSWGFPTSQGAIQSKWHDFKWISRQVTWKTSDRCTSDRKTSHRWGKVSNEEKCQICFHWTILSFTCPSVTCPSSHMSANPSSGICHLA